MIEHGTNITTENFARLGDEKFVGRMVGYRGLFRRENVWEQEYRTISGSACAKDIFVNRGKNRFQATAAVALEERIGRPIKLANDDATIQTLASAVQKIAGRCGLKPGDKDFSLLTFTQACLDQMGVAERTTPEPLASDEKMFGRISQALQQTNEAKLAKIKAEMGKEPIPPKPGAWKEEMRVIATHPLAIRELVNTGSRIKALTIAALEDIKTVGTLHTEQLAVARKLADTITPLAQSLGYGSGNEFTDMEGVIAKVADLLAIPNTSELLMIRAELRNWTSADRTPSDSILWQRINFIKANIDQNAVRIPITESIDAQAKAMAMILNCPVVKPGTDKVIGADYLQNRQIESQLKATNRSTLQDYIFLRMLTNPKMAGALALFLHHPPDSPFAENEKHHLVRQLQELATSDNIQPRVILSNILRTNPSMLKAIVDIANRQTEILSAKADAVTSMKSPRAYAEEAKARAIDILFNTGIDVDGKLSTRPEEQNRPGFANNLKDLFARIVKERPKAAGPYNVGPSIREVRLDNLIISLLYPCPADIATQAIIARIGGTPMAESLYRIIVANPDAATSAKGLLQRIIMADTQEAQDFTQGRLKTQGTSEPVKEEKI